MGIFSNNRYDSVELIEAPYEHTDYHVPIFEDKIVIERPNEGVVIFHGVRPPILAHEHGFHTDYVNFSRENEDHLNFDQIAFIYRPKLEEEDVELDGIYESKGVQLWVFRQSYVMSLSANIVEIESYDHDVNHQDSLVEACLALYELENMTNGDCIFGRLDCESYLCSHDCPRDDYDAPDQISVIDIYCMCEAICDLENIAFSLRPVEIYNDSVKTTLFSPKWIQNMTKNQYSLPSSFSLINSTPIVLDWSSEGKMPLRAQVIFVLCCSILIFLFLTFLGLCFLSFWFEYYLLLLCVCIPISIGLCLLIFIFWFYWRKWVVTHKLTIHFVYAIPPLLDGRPHQRQLTGIIEQRIMYAYCSLETYNVRNAFFKAFGLTYLSSVDYHMENFLINYGMWLQLTNCFYDVGLDTVQYEQAVTTEYRRLMSVNEYYADVESGNSTRVDTIYACMCFWYHNLDRVVGRPKYGHLL
jgi:hypothetical protein